MARPNLNDCPETRKHLQAFEVYRDLGYGRSYKKTGQIVGASTTSVSRWAQTYNWKARLEEYGNVIEAKKKEGSLVRVHDDPIAERIHTMLTEVEGLIDSAFVEDPVTLKKKSQIKIKDAKELIDVIDGYRKMLETYHKFIAEHKPSAKAGDKAQTINKFNVVMADLSQQERIQMMESLKNGHDAGGNRPAKGNPQNTDYTEVPKRGDED